jgi:FKBP-type peptidyl-prolyl cis-trans isomerase
MKRGRGGVQYKDLVEGAGEIASRGSTVEVRYTLKLNRGEILKEDVHDSFTLGERRVITGLEYGVEGMRVGGQRLIRVGPHLGYREKGVLDIVPPNAVLEFDVLLLAVRIRGLSG